MYVNYMAIFGFGKLSKLDLIILFTISNLILVYIDRMVGRTYNEFCKANF